MKKTINLLRAADGSSYFRPFALVSSLFLLWGFAHGLLDVLDKHFQNTLHISKGQSGFVQFSLYIGYLAMAYPAGVFMKKYGYKKGIILGLILFAAGAFLFYPVAKLAAFIPFLIALFIEVLPGSILKQLKLLNSRLSPSSSKVYTIGGMILVVVKFFQN